MGKYIINERIHKNIRIEHSILRWNNKEIWWFFEEKWLWRGYWKEGRKKELKIKKIEIIKLYWRIIRNTNIGRTDKRSLIIIVKNITLTSILKLTIHLG